MKLPVVLFLSVVIVLTLIPSEVRAWGGDGHKVVCAIAWDEMRPAARRKVEELLDVKGREAFADSCNWPDAYRPEHPETAPWHFLNVPHGAMRVDLERDCKEPTSCVVAQIGWQFDLLTTNAPKEDRAKALKFLGHFVGDVHQPLHVSYAEDRGGNRIRGEYFGKKRDMHGVWDFQIIEATGKSWDQIARELRRGVTATKRKEWAKGGAVEWANESLSVSLDPATQYAGVAGPYTLGEEYQAKAWPVAADRMTRAGVRLGSLLNAVLGR